MTPRMALLSGMGIDVSWQAHAACAGKDPELFFPRKGKSAEPAKRVCVGCPVRIACLRFALDPGPGDKRHAVNRERQGIFGGYTEKERRGIVRQLNQGVPIDEVVAPKLRYGCGCASCQSAGRRMLSRAS